MAIASPNALLQLLRESALLEPAQLDELSGTLPAGPGDASAVAADLVQRRWLTDYQAEQLLRGRVGELVLGPFVVLEPLGKGRVGHVFKARHRQRGHEV